MRIKIRSEEGQQLVKQEEKVDKTGSKGEQKQEVKEDNKW